MNNIKSAKAKFNSFSFTADFSVAILLAHKRILFYNRSLVIFN